MREPKTFIRKHWESGISLQEMQDKAESEGGLCSFFYEDEDRLFEEYLPQVCDDGDEFEIVIFEGEVWGLCPEGPKAYPEEIIDRYKMVAIKKDGDLFYKRIK